MESDSSEDAAQPPAQPLRLVRRAVPPLQPYGPAEADHDEEDGEEDEDSDDVDSDDLQGDGAQDGRQVVALHQFLQLLAGPPAQAAATNKDLVAKLRRSGSITSDAVHNALLVCPRGTFVPPQYARQAYVDQPIRVEEHGFNISAPHMHATCLEALDVQLGDSFLDIGCGCGVLAAAAAYMVGRQGLVAAVDIRAPCVEMSRASIEGLRSKDAESAGVVPTRPCLRADLLPQGQHAHSPLYAEAACSVEVEQLNIFVPAFRHRQRYTRIHVGATCPEDRVPVLLQLLQPKGGKILVPVEHELRLVTRAADGTVHQRIVTQVRFTDLEMPRDVDIILAASKEEDAERRRITVPPSSYDADMRAAQGVTQADGGSAAYNSSSGSSVHGHGDETGQATVSGRSLCIDGAPGGSGDAKRAKTCTDPLEACPPSTSAPSVPADPSYLRLHDHGSLLHGPTNVALVGVDWELPAHRSVLQARCEHFHALFNSGMRDAEDVTLRVPETFAKPAVEALLEYAYHDKLPEALQGQQAVELLLVAAYYGCARLVKMCEAALATELLEGDNADSAAALLALADENGLTQLATVTTSYAVQHFDRVLETESYRQLPRHLVDRLAHACFDRHRQLIQLLKDVAPPMLAPPTL